MYVYVMVKKEGHYVSAKKFARHYLFALEYALTLFNKNKRNA